MLLASLAAAVQHVQPNRQCLQSTVHIVFASFVSKIWQALLALVLWQQHRYAGLSLGLGSLDST